MSLSTDTLIVGAGPYGLSLAAYLRHLGSDFRIVGKPMDMWRQHMPRGMCLKSEGFASSLYDARDEFPLSKYCQEQGLEYADMGYPIPIDTFVSYALEFQKRFVPELDNQLVKLVRPTNPGFEAVLEDGKTISARRVVLAVGLSHYAYMPPVLADLPQGLVTHSSRHSDLSAFRGKEVLVVGSGSSAIDAAALLHQAGAAVQVVARATEVNFHDRGTVPRPLLARVKRPTTGLGPGWRSLFCVHGPLIFRLFPEQFRHKVVRIHLGPAPGWFVKEQIVGKVPLNLGLKIKKATAQGDRVRLEVMNGTSTSRAIEADHVIAGTGYKVDLDRIPFLDAAARSQIRHTERTPILSANFESSIPGLYFTGVTAASTFGPLLRFAYGARFAARRISGHLTTRS